MAKARSAGGRPGSTASGAGFVFRGTVLRAATAGAERAVFVHVDDVTVAPPALARYAGREVIVVPAKGLKVGQQTTIEAAAVSFGRDVVVRAGRVTPVAATTVRSSSTVAARAAAAPLAASPGAAKDPVEAHQDQMLKQSLDSADVVVTGTVTQVRLAPDTETMATSPLVFAGGAAGIAPNRPPQRISEHDPLWREAVVNVETVEKGVTAQKQVTVRFPGSDDVRWRDHPKLRTGQQGVFLLNQAPGGAAVGGRATAAGGGLGRGAVLMTVAVPTGALQASAAQPISAIQKVRDLLSLPQSGPAAAPIVSAAGGRRPSGKRRSRTVRRKTRKNRKNG